MVKDYDEKYKIIKFLKDCKDIFSYLVSEKDMFPSSLQAHMDSSWEIVADRIEVLVEKVNENNQSFADVGLAGAELDFKLAGFNTTYSFWKNSKFSQVILNLLDWMNIILSSLSFIIPQAEAIKEFKDALKASINSKNLDKKRIMS